MRTVPEWIGETPATALPLRVKLRVFDRHGGRCHWSGKKIAAGDRWDVDHICALANGGENRESNLAPILREKQGKDCPRHRRESQGRTHARQALWALAEEPLRDSEQGRPHRVNDRRRFCHILGDGGPLEHEQVSTTDFDAVSSFDLDAKGEPD